MRRLLLPTLLFLSIQGAAQRTERGFGTVYLEKHQFQVNLLLPGLQYEFGLLPNLTVGAEVGLSLATPSEGYSLAPAYRAFSRYYHNLEHRVAMGRKVAGNSGNYFSVSFQHYFTQLELAGNLDNEGRDLVFLGALYGIHRSFTNNFSLGLEAGAGYYFRNRISDGLGPAVNFRISWNPFGGRKKRQLP
ncbi:MAG: hypothetical protein R3252_06940 [Robiginitalea sp.]|nr:hypothetical protein [Robiginitalea sp.]